MDEATYLSFPSQITVREAQILYQKTGFRTKSRVIVTTFLDSNDVSKTELAELYNYRWLVEINFLAIKQTMQMDILRCKTPDMIYKEIWAHLLAYNKILITITYKKVGNRAGRTDPRVVKRRPKSFPRMQKSREQYKKKFG